MTLFLISSYPAENKLKSSAEFCAFRNLDAAIICIAPVTLAVLEIDLILVRNSLVLAIYY